MIDGLIISQHSSIHLAADKDEEKPPNKKIKRYTHLPAGYKQGKMVKILMSFVSSKISIFSSFLVRAGISSSIYDY